MMQLLAFEERATIRAQDAQVAARGATGSREFVRQLAEAKR
jgi:hypothetical protein